MHINNSDLAEIHEILAESDKSELTHTFAELQHVAFFALLGEFDKEDLLEELKNRQAAPWNEGDESHYALLITTVESMSEDDLWAYKDQAINAMIEDLPQSPVSYLVDEITHRAES